MRTETQSGGLVRRALTLIALVLAVSGNAVAQVSPYTTFRDREIKALSVDEIADYLSGEGMGYALAAELNGYPGPKHAVQLADSMGLDEGQRKAISQVLDRMQRRAAQLGQEIVIKERALDSLFAERRVAEGQLRGLLADIGRLQGELRYTHLGAHLEMVNILTPEQIHTYDRLRGYDTMDHGGHVQRRD